MRSPGRFVPHAGHFEAAGGGTLFLDEIGELPLPAQVKILRALQEKTVRRLGSDKPIAVDVRIIAATNRDLRAEVAAGRFREDLYYRLATGVIRLPPLRERQGDLTPLIDHFLAAANRKFADQPGMEQKTLSPPARNLLLRHPWPGNVRELQATIDRLVLWVPDVTVGADDVRHELLGTVRDGGSDLLGRPLGDGLALPSLVADLARHYLERALAEADGNKTRGSRVDRPAELPDADQLDEAVRCGAAGPGAPPMMARSLLSAQDEMTDKTMPDAIDARTQTPRRAARRRGDSSVARTSDGDAASKDGNDRVDAPAPPSTKAAAPLITAVEIENFKGIGRPMRVEFRPITLLFGNNSAGKSTVLHALCYAHEILSHGNVDVHKTDLGGDRIDLGGFRNLVHAHDPARRVRLRFELDLTDLGDAHCAIRQATLRLRGRPCRLRIDRVGGEDHVWMDRTAG